MSRSSLRPFLSCVTLLMGTTLALGGSAGLAFADGHGHDAEASGEIKYRQSLMEGVGSNMAAIGDILKNQLDLPGHVQNHASQLALAADLVSAAFKKGSAEGPTDAKAEIWTDWKGFEAAIADFDRAARNLESAAASGDPAAVGPAVKALGKSCGGCHKPYRRSKEESYKNK